MYTILFPANSQNHEFDSKYKGEGYDKTIFCVLLMGL